MAKKAREIHLKNFGKSIVLFTPMYIANYCTNRCAYCSYNMDTDIKRHKMTYEEIAKESEKIRETELKNILILTGEDKKMSSVDYILGSIDILKKSFESISIEIYPLSTKDYKRMVEKGVDGLSVYQETYDEKIYEKVHLSGPKKNYLFRLDAPERGLEAGIRSVTIGPLLGLAKWEKETFLGGLHLEYLQKKYPHAELGVSVPRIRPGSIDFHKLDTVDDVDLVHILLAYRIFLPYVGTNITTRESKYIRDNLVPICISKMSAGVTTEVGGHSLKEDSGDEQFTISDPRSVDEAIEAEKLGADYILAGHIFKTDCKKGLEARGISFLRELKSKVDIPIIAIGGICPANIQSIKEVGVKNIAVMSYIMTSNDSYCLAKRLKEKL